MKKFSTRLVVGLFIALNFVTNSLSAFAANIDITSTVTTPQTFTANNDILTIKSPSGNLAVTGAAAVSETTNTGNQIKLESGIAANAGISASGGSSSAIAVSGTATMTNIEVNGGRITSDATGTKGTISLINSGVSATTISTAVGTAITNTATAGYGITFGFDNTANHTLTLNNAGTISVNDNVASTAINIISDNNTGSNYTLNNSGLITAGANGTAFAVDAGSTSIIGLLSNSGSGSIIGDITLTNNTSTTTITNNTTGGITGDITAGSANLTVNNLAGTITGDITAVAANLDVNNSATMNSNIILGSNTSSTIALNGGVLNGDITMNSTSQLVTFAGGNLNGKIDGAGLVTANASTVLNGNIGSGTAISTLTVNSDKTLNSATNNNTINATTINLNSVGVLGSTLTTGAGATTANAINVNSSGGVGSTFNVGSGGVVIGAGNINLAAGSVLNLGTGTITTGSTGGIRATADNTGTVNFTDNNSLGVSLGNGTGGIGGSRSLLLTTLAANKTVNASSFNIDSQSVTLNSGSQLNFTSGSLMSSVTEINSGAILKLGSTASTSTLTNISSGGTLILGSGTLTGTVQGQPDGGGTVRFSENNILGGAIGTAANSVNLVTIDATKTVNAGTRNIDSNSINLAAASTLTLSTGTLTGATTMANGSILNLGSGVVTGNVNGDVAGNGTVNFGSTTTLSAPSALGQTQSLAAVNVANAATVTVNTSIAASDINIGNGVSGTLTLSGANKIFTGTVNIANGGIFNVTGAGNTINGAILGATDDDGTVNISQSLVSNGELGNTSNSLTAITVSNGATLNTATNSNNIDATGVTVTGSNSTLTLGSGTVTLGGNNLLLASTDSILNVGSGQILGNVQGASDTRGTVNFTDDYAFAGNFGNGVTGVGGTRTLFATNVSSGQNVVADTFNLDSSTITLNSGSSLHFTTGSLMASTVQLNSGSTLTLGSTVSTATTTNIGSGATLNLASGVLTGAVQGMTDATGTVNMTDNYALAGSMGTNTNSLALVTVAAGKTATANIRNINATNVTLDTGSSMVFTSGALTTLGGTTTLGSSSTLTLGTGVLASTINGVASGSGTLNFNNTNTIGVNNSVGATNSLDQINIANGATITANGSIAANSVRVGTGTSGVLTLANSLNGNVVLGNNSIMNLNSGSSVIGTIDGATANSGRVNINSGTTYTNNNGVGNTFALANITLLSGGIFNVNNDVNANVISVGGRVNFGSTSRHITGDMVGTGSTALMDFNSGSHTITGNFTTVSGNSLGVLTNTTNSGNIIATGMAMIAANTKLVVTIPVTTQIANGTTYALVSGSTGSAITAITDANINVNNTGTNSSNGHTITTSQVGNDLFLLISSAFSNSGIVTPGFISNSSTQNAYDNIMQSNNPQGELLAFQQYLNSSASNSDKSNALKSVTPQTDNSANVVTLNIVNASINLAENRLERLHTDMPSGFASGDEPTNGAVWVQGFGSSIKQSNQGNGSDGYKANLGGISIGTEKEFYNSDSHIGIAGSYANSKSTSNVGQKDIKLDSYQVNLYGGSNFGKLFVDGVAGFSWNEYASRRVIPAVGANAQADYSGQTYIGRVKTGWMQAIGNGFTLTPVISATYAQNEISEYDEEGAGTLNLHVNHNTNKFLEGRIGTVMDYVQVTSKGYSVNPQLRISYGRDFLHEKQTSENNFNGQTTSFQTEAPNVYQASWKLGGGVNILNVNSLTLSLDYNHEIKHDYHANTGSLRLKYNF